MSHFAAYVNTMVKNFEHWFLLNTFKWQVEPEGGVWIQQERWYSYAKMKFIPFLNCIEWCKAAPWNWPLNFDWPIPWFWTCWGLKDCELKIWWCDRFLKRVAIEKRKVYKLDSRSWKRKRPTYGEKLVLRTVHKLRLQEEVGRWSKKSTFCKLLYHRKCKRRGVGGQKKPNFVNVVCERPLIGNLSKIVFFLF